MSETYYNKYKKYKYKYFNLLGAGKCSKGELTQIKIDHLVKKLKAAHKRLNISVSEMCKPTGKEIDAGCSKILLIKIFDQLNLKNAPMFRAKVIEAIQALKNLVKNKSKTDPSLHFIKKLFINNVSNKEQNEFMSTDAECIFETALSHAQNQNGGEFYGGSTLSGDEKQAEFGMIMAILVSLFLLPALFTLIDNITDEARKQGR